MTTAYQYNLNGLIGFFSTVGLFFGSIGLAVAMPAIWRKLRRR